MFGYFNFLNYIKDEKIIEKINNFSLSNQSQRIKYLEFS